MKYFDSHAHYYDDRFSEEYEGSVDDLIDALLSNEVSHIINVGTSPTTSRLAIEQAKKFTRMHTSIGIHPSDAQYLSVDIDTAIADIESLIRNKENKCLALGEIGLDYHYPDTDKELQMKYFDAQMTLAKELDLPVVIHDRDSHEDVIDMIKSHRGVRGVLHSFSGSAEMAKEIVRLGFMVSFSGTVSFKNARRPKEAAAVVPKDMILIETDAPYLAPHPKRGTLNHSGNLVYTNVALAEAIGISPEECAIITDENARRFFSLK